MSATEGWTGGEFLHTTTAGSLWTLQTPSATRQDLSAVDFVDLLNGWAVGAAGTIVHTADAGASWTVQASGTTDDLTSVDFVDRRNGWAVGGTDAHSWPPHSSRTILHTGDGGLTWETQLDPSDSPLQDVEFVDSLSGWVVGDGGTILHTGGRRRELVPAGLGDDHSSCVRQLRQHLDRVGRQLAAAPWCTRPTAVRPGRPRAFRSDQAMTKAVTSLASTS